MVYIFKISHKNIWTGQDKTTKFYIYFHCAEDAGDYKIVSAGEMNNCEYHMYIDTIWGCAGMLTDQSSDQLSPGTYFIILLFGGLLLYCCIGWIISCIDNGKYGDLFQIYHILHFGVNYQVL